MNKYEEIRLIKIHDGSKIIYRTLKKHIMNLK